MSSRSARPRRAGSLSRLAVGSRALALLAGCSLLASCFEQPIEQRLTLRFVPAGVEVQLEVDLNAPWRLDEEKPVVRRLRQAEEELLSDLDPWRARFARLRPDEESYHWRRSDGILRHVERRAEVAERQRVAALLRDTGIELAYAERDGVAEFSIDAGVATGATRREHRQMEELLGLWSEYVARYLLVAADIWADLERTPERALPIFVGIFDDVDPEILTAEEIERVEALHEAMEEVFQILLLEDGEAETLQEISRRVYDPFPASVRVEVPGPVLEVQGFASGPARNDSATGVGTHSYEVPELGLWQALEANSGRWLTPDPLSILVEAALADPVGDGESSGPDIEELAQRTRTAAPPRDGAEVEEALRAHLEPAPYYVLRWREPSSGEVD